VVSARWGQPKSVVEPTCGRGEFLVAASTTFSQLEQAVGLEINPSYVEAARETTRCHAGPVVPVIREGDFFTTNWDAVLDSLPDPLLVIGNPPWVTNAGIGAIRGSNLPQKSNFQRHQGLDAVTGKSNFDISEWMLLHLIERLRGRNAILAMLCKTAVARKVLLQGWQRGLIGRAEIRLIDAKKHFGAAVDACLLVCRVDEAVTDSVAPVYPEVEADRASHTIGLRDERLVSDVDAYERTKHLGGRSAHLWRSGIKHDCAKVMELQCEGSRYRNGMGELVELEEDFTYPMLKSSDVASRNVDAPTRWLIVTQKHVGQDTRPIAAIAPKTWAYLQSHAEKLDRRASSIYRGRPRFAMFGIGDYSFAPYKVAVSGLYKHLTFARIGQHRKRPIVLDDTCSLLPCRTMRESEFVVELLHSELVESFLQARIFWDSKRPITSEVLNQLDVLACANELVPTHPITVEWVDRHLRSLVAQRKLF